MGMRNAELFWMLKDNADVRSTIKRLGGAVRKRCLMYDKQLEG